MASPQVTFLMAVFNGAATVRAAVESVLRQTFDDLELLVVDDGSTDETGEILRSLRGEGERIQVVKNERNLGLSASLNRGLEMARGDYVARMDADDICLPERAAVQVAHLEEHRDVALIGSFVETFTAERGGVVTGEALTYPTDPDAVGAALLFRSALAHPSVMFRRQALADMRYPQEFRYAQDYALWFDCTAKGLRLANVAQVLLRYRVHPGQLSAQFERMQGEGTVIRSRFLRWFVPDLTDEELALHDAISRDRWVPDPSWLGKAAEWLTKLSGVNERRRVFGQEAFLRALTGRYVALRRFAAARNIATGDPRASVFAPFIRSDALE